ncbi:MAG: hypothetical protein EOO38_16595 [Cytophagaceae bacterium]|nr:MAG: hypothetical protein EOO38_16595 [Cytophagaceae bacterium]
MPRSPLHDSIFFFLDATFKGSVSFGVFLRSIVTFAMFGASDLVSWVFTLVVEGTVLRAERADAVYSKSEYHPGVQGVDPRTNLPTRWPEVSKWSALPTLKSPFGGMTYQSFVNLMYHIHNPTANYMAAIKKAMVAAQAVFDDTGNISSGFR